MGELSLYAAGRTFENKDLTSGELGLAMAMLGVGLLQVGTFLVTIVLFCIWNVRVYRNLLPLGVSRLEHSPGWAAGAWFVPILNWFRPYQIMQEIWKGSDPENLRRSSVPPYPRAVGSTMVGWWWAMWIIGNVVNQISFRAEWHAEGSIEMLQVAAVASIVGSAVTIVCAALAIQIVRKINEHQQDRYQLVGGQQPSFATW